MRPFVIKVTTWVSEVFQRLCPEPARYVTSMNVRKATFILYAVPVRSGCIARLKVMSRPSH